MRLSDEDRAKPECSQRDDRGDGGLKKPYATPRLIVHGSIAKITLGAKAGGSDIGGLTATGL